MTQSQRDISASPAPALRTETIFLQALAALLRARFRACSAVTMRSRSRENRLTNKSPMISQHKFPLSGWNWHEMSYFADLCCKMLDAGALPLAVFAADDVRLS